MQLAATTATIGTVCYLFQRIEDYFYRGFFSSLQEENLKATTVYKPVLEVEPKGEVSRIKATATAILNQMGRFEGAGKASNQLEYEMDSFIHHSDHSEIWSHKLGIQIPVDTESFLLCYAAGLLTFVFKHKSLFSLDSMCHYDTTRVMRNPLIVIFRQVQSAASLEDFQKLLKDKLLMSNMVGWLKFLLPRNGSLEPQEIVKRLEDLLHLRINISVEDSDLYISPNADGEVVQEHPNKYLYYTDFCDPILK